jgi:hypothetical protein
VIVFLDEPETSSVSAYWEDEEVMSAAINTTSDLYVIEASIRHMKPVIVIVKPINITEYPMNNHFSAVYCVAIVMKHLKFQLILSSLK